MEAVVGLVINCLAGPVNNLCTAACSTIISIKDNIDSLEHEVQELRCRKEKIVKELEDAEMKGKVPAPDVMYWIENAEKLPGKAKNVEDDFKKLSKCLGDCSPNVVSSYQLSKRAERLLKDAKELKDKNFQEIATEPAAGDSMKWSVGSIVGRASELKQLQKLLADENISIIGIYGMAGVGKTVFLEKFYNDFQEKGSYRMYWVNMDRCLNVEDAQDAIVDELRLSLSENDKKDTKAKHRRIYGYLQDRNFVLVLDNVWKPVNLNDVGIPTAAKGMYKSKVILTTRLEDVCDQMEAQKLEMKCLGQGTAWILFWRMVGDRVIYSDPWIASDALQLVKKCAGLPLALVTLGRSMKSKRTSKSWSLAIKQLDFAPWEIKYMEEELLRRLKPSYDNLADDKLKTCFFYCCLFPAGSLIYEERIICYCIGEGIIRDPFEDATDMFNLGHDLLSSLRASSLLEESNYDSYFKMHPIIRALPLLMECEHGANEKWLVRTQLGLTEAPDVEKWRRVERVSLMNNSINALHDIPDSPCLLTLLMSHNKELEKICEGFFRSMRKLRVLDLSYTCISEVPTEIGELVGLLYLNFSNTKLKTLPREMENLVRLRALLLSRTPELTVIPQGLIKKLSELRLLCMYISYEDWKVDSVEDGVDFRELNSLRQLKVVGISLNTAPALRKLAESYRLSKSVRELEIRLSPNLRTLSTATNLRYKALKCLRLSCCTDLKELEICSPLPNLTELYLMQLPITKMTCLSGCLESLSRIEITNCRNMRQLIPCDEGPEEKEKGPEEEIKVQSHRKIPTYGKKRPGIIPDDDDDDSDYEAFKEALKEKEQRPEEKENGPEEKDKVVGPRKIPNYGEKRPGIIPDDDDEAFKEGPKEKEERQEEKDNVARRRKIPNYGEKRPWIIPDDDDDDDEAFKEGPKEKEERPEEKEKGPEEETGSSGINILPKLKQLKLSHLPELESLSYGGRPLAFPSLETLDVKECIKLNKIPLNAARLRQIHGQRSWWNGLEWPDDNKSRSRFQSYFKAIYPEPMG